MARKLSREQIAEQAFIHTAPFAEAPRYIPNAPLDRSFELPTALYAATVGLFLTYIATMLVGSAHPQLIVPGAIFVLFIVAAFGVPALWVRMQPDNPVRALSWACFKAEGIRTATGHATAGAATAQVLVLPVLLALWGVAVVTIAAVVA